MLREIWPPLWDQCMTPEDENRSDALEINKYMIQQAMATLTSANLLILLMASQWRH